MIRAPPSGRLAAVIVPPWATTSWRAIVSPSPLPPESAGRAKRSKMRSGSPAMPGPVSLTVTPRRRPARRRRRRPDRPAGVWRRAFVITFVTTWAMRNGSASTTHRCRRRRPPPRRRSERRAAPARPRRRRRPQRGRPSRGAGRAARRRRGEGAQVLDEAVERAGLVEQQVEAGVVARVDAVELQLDLPLQHGERRAQLVGDVGQEAVASGLGRVEPGGHVVEGVPERAHGPRPARVDAGGVLAGPDALGALEQVAHRPGQPAVGEHGRADGADDADDEHARRAAPIAAPLVARGAETIPEPIQITAGGDGEAQEAPAPPAGVVAGWRPGPTVRPAHSSRGRRRADCRVGLGHGSARR